MKRRDLSSALPSLQHYHHQRGGREEESSRWSVTAEGEVLRSCPHPRPHSPFLCSSVPHLHLETLDKPLVLRGFLGAPGLDNLEPGKGEREEAKKAVAFALLPEPQEGTAYPSIPAGALPGTGSQLSTEQVEHAGGGAQAPGQSAAPSPHYFPAFLGHTGSHTQEARRSGIRSLGCLPVQLPPQS